jgi:hypothetical protein
MNDLQLGGVVKHPAVTFSTPFKFTTKFNAAIF